MCLIILYIYIYIYTYELNPRLSLNQNKCDETQIRQTKYNRSRRASAGIHYGSAVLLPKKKKKKKKTKHERKEEKPAEKEKKKKYKTIDGLVRYSRIWRNCIGAEYVDAEYIYIYTRCFKRVFGGIQNFQE
jgi:hypothetical protein